MFNNNSFELFGIIYIAIAITFNILNKKSFKYIISQMTIHIFKKLSNYFDISYPKQSLTHMNRI
jgi:hypothetical protein